MVRCEDARFLPQVQHPLKCQIQEIATSASRVQDADVGQLFYPCVQLPLHLFPKPVVSGSLGFAGGLSERRSLRFHVSPARLQRGHYDGFHDQQNVLRAGVVRSNLRALTGIETSLKESAEDRRLHVGPVQGGGLAERGHIRRGEFERLIIGEESAVEPCNIERAEVVSAGAHGAE